MPLPRKIKIFLWRGYHHGLPTGEQLCKRGLYGNIKCHICHYIVEDDLHPFIRCWWSQSVWSYLGIKLPDCCQNITSFADLLYQCFHIMEPEKLHKSMVALWYLWYHRNMVVHNTRSLSPLTASKNIIRLHNDFCRNNKGLIQGMSPIGLSWQKPKGGFLKVNCDASWRQGEKKGGIGVVLRDHTGGVLGINALHLNHVTSIEDAEGTALWEGMKLAESLKLEKVIFEVDNKEVTMAVNYCVKEGVWTSDWFIASSRFLESHSDWKVVLVRREANMAADTIAKKANIEEWCWRKLDSLPYICDFVQLL
ncbi:hypothetical protein QQ045_016777 [Rhodiola kirilowii]